MRVHAGRRRPARHQRGWLCADQPPSTGRPARPVDDDGCACHGRFANIARDVGGQLHRPEPRRLGLLPSRQDQRARLHLDLHTGHGSWPLHDPRALGHDLARRGCRARGAPCRGRLRGRQPGCFVLAEPRGVPRTDFDAGLRPGQPGGVEDLSQGRRQPLLRRRGHQESRLRPDVAPHRPARPTTSTPVSWVGGLPPTSRPAARS